MGYMEVFHDYLANKKTADVARSEIEMMLPKLLHLHQHLVGQR